MKIIHIEKVIKSRAKIVHATEFYYRTEYVNGTIKWEFVHSDVAHPDGGKLEEEYQKLIKK